MMILISIIHNHTSNDDDDDDDDDEYNNDKDNDNDTTTTTTNNNNNNNNNSRDPNRAWGPAPPADAGMIRLETLHRAQIYRFELFELFPLLRLYNELSMERF